jgi:hypothetical protein
MLVVVAGKKSSNDMNQTSETTTTSSPFGNNHELQNPTRLTLAFGCISSSRSRRNTLASAPRLMPFCVQTALTNEYQHWLMVLDLTKRAGGSHPLVKTQRGRLFVVPSDEAEALRVMAMRRMWLMVDKDARC